MSSHPYRPPHALPVPGRSRHLAASVLRAASRALVRAARRLTRAQARARGEPVLEFYAQAGAPEGALYVDGQLVGTLQGVNRL